MIPQKYAGAANPLGAAIVDVLGLPESQELHLHFNVDGTIRGTCSFLVEGNVEHEVFELFTQETEDGLEVKRHVAP